MKTITQRSTSVIALFLISFCFSFQGLGQCTNSVLFNNLNRSAFLTPTNAYYSGANGGFTWECWFRLTQPLGGTQIRPLIVASDAVVFEDFWLGFGWSGGFFNQPTNKLVFLVYGPNGMAPTSPNCSYEPAGGFQVGIWYHVAATMNYITHESKLFLNGVQVDSKQTNVLPNPRIIATSLSCPLVENNQLTLDGNMDEVRIWSKPLTAQEIHDSYQNCISWAEPNLEFYSHCNDGGQTVYDITMYQRHADLSAAGGLWSADSAPLADQSCMAHCSTCPLLDTGPDVMTCGGSVQLSATPGWPNYTWSPSAGMSDPSLADQTVSPSVTTTYTVQSTDLGPNLVINGDFSQGDVGFTSDYTSSTNPSPCNYHVGPQFFNVDPTLTDHTPTNDNMSLAADGCTTGNEVLWRQTFVVEPYTNYLFSFWATRAAQYQPIFQTTIIGDVTGPQILLTETTPPSTGTWIWDNYGDQTWNSANNNTVTITVSNVELNGWGNDFALDDFTLRQECNMSSQITVYVGGMPVNLGPDLQICSGTSQVLNAGNGYQSYLWNNGSTASTLTVTNSGTYWVVANDSCGGTHSDTIQVTMVTPPVLDLGNDLQICAGDTIQIVSASGAFTNYQWSGNALSCHACKDPEAFPVNSTLYTLTATTAAGCVATDNLSVVIVPLPTVELGNDIHICAGDTAYLSNSVPLNNYQWSPVAGISCSNCPDPGVSPAATATYFLTSGNPLGCTATDSINIYVAPLPALELGNDLTICKGESTSFNFTLPSSYISFSWTPSSGLSCSDCINPEAFPSDSTNYILSAYTADGCVAIDSIHVFIRDDAPENVLTTIEDATCSEGGTVIIEAVGNGTDVLQYNFGSQGFSENPLYQQVQPGNYLLAVRNGDEGCLYNGVVAVGGDYNSIFIPNAFTPDGNETNNTWSIHGNCITEISCRIFNRWGEEVAFLSDLSQSWDGTMKAQMLPDGLYTYIVEVTYASYNKERITGFVALLR